MTSPDTPPAMPDPHQPYPVSYPQPEQEPLTLANVLPAGQHRSRARLVVGLTAALVLVGVVVGTVGVLTLKNIGPFKDSGIAICENIRDHGKSSASASPSGDAATSSNNTKFTTDQYHKLRRQFADSRYGDLRDAGTKFVDLAWQFSRTSDENALGALLAMGGQIVSAYSSLAGACANHGVDIPPLGG